MRIVLLAILTAALTLASPTVFTAFAEEGAGEKRRPPLPPRRPRRMS